MGGNAVASVKSISFGIFRWVPHERAVWLVRRLVSSPIDVAMDALGDRCVWYFDIAAEYFEVPEFSDPNEPLGLNFLAMCGL